eukprot:scaffold317114_cov265-Cyclotella_meneghiniana.AAC.1
MFEKPPHPHPEINVIVMGNIVRIVIDMKLAQYSQFDHSNTLDFYNFVKDVNKLGVTNNLGAN